MKGINWVWLTDLIYPDTNMTGLSMTDSFQNHKADERQSHKKPKGDIAGTLATAGPSQPPSRAHNHQAAQALRLAFRGWLCAELQLYQSTSNVGALCHSVAQLPSSPPLADS